MIYYNQIEQCGSYFVWYLRLGLLLVYVLYKEDYLQILRCVSFWLHSFYG